MTDEIERRIGFWVKLDGDHRSHQTVRFASTSGEMQVALPAFAWDAMGRPTKLSVDVEVVD